MLIDALHWADPPRSRYSFKQTMHTAVSRARKRLSCDSSDMSIRPLALNLPLTSASKARTSDTSTAAGNSISSMENSTCLVGCTSHAATASASDRDTCSPALLRCFSQMTSDITEPSPSNVWASRSQHRLSCLDSFVASGSQDIAAWSDPPPVVLTAIEWASTFLNSAAMVLKGDVCHFVQLHSGRLNKLRLFAGLGVDQLAGWSCSGSSSSSFSSVSGAVYLIPCSLTISHFSLDTK